MNASRKILTALAAALTLGLATPIPASADVTDAQIAAARTPAEHEVIAKAYDADAKAAEAKATEHEAMAKTYRNAGGPKMDTNSMVHHCDRLVKEYKAAAAEYRALAAEHRKMAAAAGK